MLIELTRAQWVALQPLVRQGTQAEAHLGIPVEIEKDGEKIEIATAEIKITLSD